MTQNNNHTTGWKIAIKQPVFWIAFVIAIAIGFMLGGKPSGEPSGAMATTADTTQATIWTCSMHPQIRLPKPGKCPICFMDLIPVTQESQADDGPRVLSMSETAKKLAQIVTAPVERRFADASLQMVGQIQYDERRVANIAAWVPGRLDKLYVDFTGVAVSAGDPMVQIYSPQLLSAQEELLQAIATAASVNQSKLTTIRQTAKETIESARDKLHLWGLTDKQIADIESRGTPSDHITIHAPTGGVVVKKSALEGQYVQTGTSIYTIADLSEVWLDLEAYESDLPWLRVGQTIRFSTESFPGETFSGKIAFIDPVLDTRTRTVRVRVNVPNNDMRLKPGMFARATVKAGVDNVDHNRSGKPPLIIPASAPLITGRRAVVYVALPDKDRPTYEGREVVLGPRAGDYYVVDSGLVEGEQVVVNGAFRIDSELQIRAKPSMMSPEGGMPMVHEHEGPRPKNKAGKILPPEKRARIAGLPQAFTAQLEPIYAAYFDLHTALANDKASDAKTTVERLHQTIMAVDASSLGTTGGDTWTQVSGHLADLTTLNPSENNIDGLRVAFEMIADGMIELDYYFGHPDTIEHYVTFCPMAFDNRGAYWLQNTKAIANPYFGHEMPKCGKVTDQIDPDHEH